MSIWNTSLNILARREHSQTELYAKLKVRFPEQLPEIDDVIQRLKSQGLQSDERFAQLWFNSQLAKRRGPNRIINEARHKGVVDQVESLLGQTDCDWFQLAFDTVSRRYPEGASYEDKAKIYRFLSYRGFSSDMIQFAYDELVTLYKANHIENSYE